MYQLSSWKLNIWLDLVLAGEHALCTYPWIDFNTDRHTHRNIHHEQHKQILISITNHSEKPPPQKAHQKTKVKTNVFSLLSILLHSFYLTNMNTKCCCCFWKEVNHLDLHPVHSYYLSKTFWKNICITNACHIVKFAIHFHILRQSVLILALTKW